MQSIIAIALYYDQFSLVIDKSFFIEENEINRFIFNCEEKFTTINEISSLFFFFFFEIESDIFSSRNCFIITHL